MIYQLLQQGKKVIATVRGENRISGLKKVFPEQIKTGQLAFVYASLGDNQQQLEQHIFDKNKKITSVIHVATPFPELSTIKGALDGSEKPAGLEDSTLKPAVNGTKAMVAAVKNAAPQVKRFVFRSSFATIRPPMGVNSDPNHVYTEQDWSDLPYDPNVADPLIAYAMSKLYAEKAAWQFVEDNDNLNFDFKSMVIPGMFGGMRLPLEAKSKLNMSNYLIVAGYGASALPPRIHSIRQVYVNVKAVASALVQSSDPSLSPSSHSRYMVFSGDYSFPYVYGLLKQMYPDHPFFCP